MAEVNSTQYGETVLKPVIAEAIDTTEENLNYYSTAVFNEFTTQDAFETDRKDAGPGAAIQYAEFDNVTFDEMLPGWTYRYTLLDWALGLNLSYRSLEVLRVNVIGDPVTKLRKSVHVAEEQHAANIFNNAFSGSYTFGDGKSLIASDHPLIAGGTASNLIGTAADLSTDLLEEGVQAIIWGVDDRGFVAERNVARVIVAPSQAVRITELTKTMRGKAETADNTMNVYAAGQFALDPFIWPYLTDADATFILSPKAQHKLKKWRRMPFKISKTMNNKNQSWEIIATASFTHGASDWPGIWGSPGA